MSNINLENLASETRGKFDVLAKEYTKTAVTQRNFEHVMNVLIHALISLAISQGINADKFSDMMVKNTRSDEYWNAVLKKYLGGEGLNNTDNVATRVSQSLKRKKFK